MHTYFSESDKDRECRNQENRQSKSISYISCYSLSNNNYLKIAQFQTAKMNKADLYDQDNKCKTSRLFQLNIESVPFADHPSTKNSPLKNKCAVHSTLTDECRMREGAGNVNRGSAALEAVCVIPILFFAFLGFYIMGQIYIMDNQIYQVGRNTAEYLAEYAYAAECGIEDADGIGADILGLGLANARIQKELKDNTRVAQYVKGGRQGVYAQSLNLIDQEGYISFVLHYQIQIPLPFLNTISAHIRIPICQKAYIGYIPDGSETDENHTYVYVTEHGTVYHRTKSCSHLKVMIHPVSAAILRTEYKRLPPCEYCGNAKTDTYYISEYGECYHSDAACSRLQRTIHRVRLQDVEGMGACSSCGGG